MSTTIPPLEAGPPAPVPGRPARPSFATRLRRGSLLILVLAAAGFALYSWAALAYVYSEGDRAGYVQKFSRKGWVCKTWEGELAMVNLPGQPAEIFPFTVRDENVARQIESAMGQRVSLTYDYHPFLPVSCFGETKYFVVGIKVVHTP